MALEIRVPTLGESVTEATVAKWLQQCRRRGRRRRAAGRARDRQGDGRGATRPRPARSARSRSTPAPRSKSARCSAPSAEGAAPAKKPATAAAVPPKAAAPKPRRSRARPAAAPAGAGGCKGSGPRRAQADGRDRRRTRRPEPARTAASPRATCWPRCRASPRRRSRRRRRARPRALGEREERVKMTRLRKRIAERLKEAQNTAAMLTTFNEMRHERGDGAARALQGRASRRSTACKLGFMSFFVKACIVALKELPGVNAEIDGDDIIYKNHYDIGVAVSAPQGLVVPVVRDADRDELRRDREDDRRARQARRATASCRSTS